MYSIATVAPLFFVMPLQYDPLFIMIHYRGVKHAGFFLEGRFAPVAFLPLIHCGSLPALFPATPPRLPYRGSCNCLSLIFNTEGATATACNLDPPPGECHSSSFVSPDCLTLEGRPRWEIAFH